MRGRGGQAQLHADSVQTCKLPPNVKVPHVGIKYYTEIKEMQIIHQSSALS